MEFVQGNEINGYKLVERIGNGGFGAVYRAYQTTINREVAIKFILPGYANDPDFIRRFEIEAQLVARLEHPHITPLIDYWRDPDGAYLVMRYLKGGSIHQALKSGAYELESAAQILDQIASALDFAHRQNVIHRDIKPGNILLDEDGNAYLADFGIAKDLSGLMDGNTAMDSVVGSLDYISPEQARSEPVTGRTDIYSLGVTLYEMITGEHPFHEASTLQRLYHHINDPLPDIESLSDPYRDAINDVIHRATAKDPDKRYPDVTAFALAFSESIGRGSTTQQQSIVEQLTLREQEILDLITQGLTNAQIAQKLVVTVSTVKWHIRQLYKKLGVRGRVQAIVRARELNLVVTGDTTVDAPTVVQSSTSISLPEPENPYKGLHAFQSTDSRDFFGRDDLVSKLIDRLQQNDTFHRFLAIVGPSGSGKSSLVRAGVIPALWTGAIDGSEKWFVVDMIPGKRPLDKLETSLVRVAANHASNLNEQLRRDAHGLERVADIILPNDDTELVIVIDQFEEVFTLVEDETERQHFLDLLRFAVSDERSRIRVVVTLRADYYDRPLHYPEFGQLLRNRMETVLPLSAKGLERAIRGPAERVGVTFEQGLVEQIVSEMNYQAGALPLLQYALTELFDQRDGRLLTNKAYQEIGGAIGALANRADEIYQSMPEDARTLIHQMFMRLVTLGEGAEDTRRRAAHSELLALTDQTDLMEEIIDHFADYRLLSLDHDPETRQPTVEVAHEAILREWERLRHWLNESRTEIRLQQQINLAAREWRESREDAGFLLYGSRLEQFGAWADQTQLTLTQREKHFLAESLQERDRLNALEQERQARETAQEQRSQTLLRALVGVFALAAIISGGFGTFAFIQRNEAVDARNEVIEAQEDTLEALDIAQRSGLALAAGDAMDENEVDLAIALSIESMGMGETSLLPETRRVLERIENEGGPIFRGESENYCGWDSSRHGRYFVKFACDGDNYSFNMWDTTTLELVATVDHNEPMNLAGFSADFSRMITFDAPTGTSLDGVNITIWDVETWTVLAQYPVDDPIYFNVIYSADPDYFYTFEYSDTLSNFDTRFYVAASVTLRLAETGEAVRRFTYDDMAMQSYDYSDDGTMVAVGGWSGFDGVGVDDYRAVIFDVATGDVLQVIDRPHNDLHPAIRAGARVFFADDDSKLILSGFPNYVIDIETGMDVADIVVPHDKSIRSRPSLNFETVLLYNDETTFIELYNLMTGETLPLKMNELTATALPYQIISQEPGRLEEFLAWDLRPREAIIAQRTLPSGVTDVEYSPDGRYIATVGSAWNTTAHFNSNTIIYDAETLEEVARLDAVHAETGLQTNVSWGLQWSPDGSMLATATFDEGVILWDTTTWQEIRRFTGTQDYVMQIRFMDDGQSLIATSGNYFTALPYEDAPQIVKWDIATGEEIRRYVLPADHLPHYGIPFFALHPDESVAYITLNTEQQDGSVDNFLGYFLDMETGEASLVDEDISAGGFTPDGSRLLKFDMVNSTIILYDYPSMDMIRRIPIFDDLFGVDISPDGRYLVTGAGALAFESAVTLYDLETGEVVRRYFGHREQTFNPHVSFHPDGTRFITSGFDTQLIVWEFDPTPTIDWVRENRLVRDFSCTERIQYRIEPLCETDE